MSTKVTNFTYGGNFFGEKAKSDANEAEESEAEENNVEERETNEDTTHEGGKTKKPKKSLALRKSQASRQIIQELSLDPMFVVLHHYLVSKNGNSLVDILDEIKDHLAFLRSRVR